MSRGLTRAFPLLNALLLGMLGTVFPKSPIDLLITNARIVNGTGTTTSEGSIADGRSVSASNGSSDQAAA